MMRTTDGESRLNSSAADGCPAVAVAVAVAGAVVVAGVAAPTGVDNSAAIGSAAARDGNVAVVATMIAVSALRYA